MTVATLRVTDRISRFIGGLAFCGMATRMRPVFIRMSRLSQCHQKNGAHPEEADMFEKRTHYGKELISPFLRFVNLTARFYGNSFTSPSWAQGRWFLFAAETLSRVLASMMAAVSTAWKGGDGFLEKRCLVRWTRDLSKFDSLSKSSMIETMRGATFFRTRNRPRFG